MELEWHGSQIPAVVRGQRLHRHRALLDEGRRAAVVLLAQGPPRAWQRSLEAAVLGVVEGLEASSRAEEILSSAAKRVRATADSLVDSGVVQVNAVAFTVSPEGEAELATAGSCRAYLSRTSEHRRISAKGARKGLSDSIAFPKTKEQLVPGDVVILGPSHMFGVTGVAALARLLHQGEPASPRRVVRGLLSMCRSQETGGASIVLRVSA